MAPSVSDHVTAYDQRYFDKWYRNPAHRVSTPTATKRKVALALSVAEYYLERPVGSVLDIGCGEGNWQPILQRLRPKLQYTGVDSSRYAVRRFGRRRHLLLGGFADLADLSLAASYDLIICSDALYYVPRRELERGFPAMVQRLGGVAFLEAYASSEALSGDIHGMEKRSPEFYRRLFCRHGLVSCGSHCYLGPLMAGQATALERGGG